MEKKDLIELVRNADLDTARECLQNIISYCDVDGVINENELRDIVTDHCRPGGPVWWTPKKEAR